jgi:hypothetical protein
MIECFAQLSLLEQRKAQAEVRRLVVGVPGKQLAEQVLRQLILALAQGAFGSAARLVRRLSRRHTDETRDDHEAHDESGQAQGC